MKNLKNVLYLVTNDFCEKLCLSFLITDTHSFIFKMALSTCCSELSFLKKETCHQQTVLHLLLVCWVSHCKQEK